MKKRVTLAYLKKWGGNWIRQGVFTGGVQEKSAVQSLAREPDLKLL